MKNELFDIQKGIVSRLRATPALMSIIVGVYDDVPQAAKAEVESAFPFIVVGDDDYTDWSTDTEIGYEGTLQINVWSRYSGKKEITDIFTRLRDTLDRKTIPFDSYKIMDIQYTGHNTFLEPDGRTRRGIISFSIRFEE
jgi:hypothetical protein